MIRLNHQNRDRVSIDLPKSLYDKVKERAEKGGFSSTSEYVAKVLREKLSETEEWREPFTKEDEERIKERLRALGYLD